MQRYCDAANCALEAGYLSETGRVETKGRVSAAAQRAATRERRLAEREGRPYSGVVGHGPDTTWTGKPEAYEWIDMSREINGSLARQSAEYPIGYKPTVFELLYGDK
jgi:hypothetical protein